MGIRMSATEESVGRGAFSQDILKIEIAGPDVDYRPSLLLSYTYG